MLPQDSSHAVHARSVHENPARPVVKRPSSVRGRLPARRAVSDSAGSTLLTDPDYYGSLAAVRDLGRAGVSVRVADEQGQRSRSATSRFCRQRVVGPVAAQHSDHRLAFLLEQGREHEGTFLYPTSDDMAWLVARHQDALRTHFRLYQPSADATFGLLDKSRLYAHAETAGVPFPATHAPTTLTALAELCAHLERSGGFPVILKPRTQAGLRNKVKGQIVTTTAELLAGVSQMRQPGFYEADFLQSAPTDITWPLVQRYMPDAQQNTYSVSGFIDATGTLRAARASVKVFQIPVRIGVGVAFEGRPLVPRLITRIEQIARATGYHGVCEVEFIHVAKQDLYYLMDFNPRYYGQMQFEISRGLALPRLAHAAAHGRDAEVSALCDTADDIHRTTNPASQRYCNRWLFQSLLRAQRLSGRMPADRHAAWLQWMDGREVFDSVRADDDPAPAVADRSRHLRRWVRHPRSGYRELFQ